MEEVDQTLESFRAVLNTLEAENTRLREENYELNRDVEKLRRMIYDRDNTEKFNRISQTLLSYSQFLDPSDFRFLDPEYLN